ncbi:hypothetical protein FGB62_121g015 [Gracilaria domingensis]|nr:hypothetical protein FGB62_121g015 [Gracilaria domingensis]
MVILWEGLGQRDVANADGPARLDASALGSANDAISNVFRAVDKRAAVHAGAGESRESGSGWWRRVLAARGAVAAAPPLYVAARGRLTQKNMASNARQPRVGGAPRTAGLAGPAC